MKQKYHKLNHKNKAKKKLKDNQDSSIAALGLK
jgi:hypothetical protein